MAATRQDKGAFQTRPRQWPVQTTTLALAGGALPKLARQGTAYRPCSLTGASRLQLLLGHSLSRPD